MARLQALPAPASPPLKRRLGQAAIGTVLWGAGAVLALAILTYDHQDPSHDQVINGPTHNILGPPGAEIANAAWQYLGLPAILLPLAFACWGTHLLLRHRLRWGWARVMVLLLAVPAPALLSPPSFPGALSTLGDFWLKQAHIPRPLSLLVALLVAIPALVFSLGLPAPHLPLGKWARQWAHVGIARWHAWRAARAPRQREARRPRAEPLLSDTAAAAPAITSARTPINVVPPSPRKKSEPKRQASLDLAPEGAHKLPPLSLLAEGGGAKGAVINEEALQQNARLLLSVLEDFGVRGQIVKVRPGPVVTLYELEPAAGIKASRVIGLADDIARSMSAISARVAVIPGRNVIGIELPNAKAETVLLRELLDQPSYTESQARLTLVLGKDIGGAPVIADLARMPHLLIAGTTGSGKSVGINTMILSVLYRLPPDQCKFIMIDPKMLELSVYDGIPHLLCPVVTEPKKAVVALKWTVREMESRYRAMSKLGVRNIEGYNQRLAEAQMSEETLTRKVQTGFDPETGNPVFEEQKLDTTPLPLIVVVVDEMADLMLVAGKEIEMAVQRLAQMARAAGIHIVMATQRPSVDVITGTIKANFPTRISFQVTSKIDSRTILGEAGAEQLLGRGDMLYMAGGGRITRVHGPFVADQEVEAVVRFLKEHGGEPSYIEEITEEEEERGEGGADEEGGSGDTLYDQAVALVCRERKASTSFVQRHLQIGYNRAARLIERMESEGVVSPANHVGKREVLARNIE